MLISIHIHTHGQKIGLTFLIVLRSGVVKGMSQLMSSNSSKSAVSQVCRPRKRVEGGLKDTGRENNFTIRRGVIGVDG